MKNLTSSLLLLFLVSCASNVRVAKVPTFIYNESNFNYGPPNDITITLKPSGSKWETDSGVKVEMGADLQTILEAIYPEGDSFIYGKVTKQQNLTTLPLPMPIPIILKNETVMNIRALQVGKHK